MVEICVAVADAAGAHGLLRRLAGLFDRSSVSFDGTRNEVRVRSESESRGVVQVLHAVETWLAEDGPDWTKLSVGDRSYTMVRPTGLEAPRERARVMALVPQPIAPTNGKPAIAPLAQNLAG